MANQLYRFTASFVDDNGVKTAVHQYAELPEAVTGTQLSGNLGDWVTAISDLSDGVPTRCEVALHVPPSTYSLPTTPGDEEVSEIAGFQMNLTGSSFSDSPIVPAFKESAQVGNKVDLTNTDVIALTTLLTSALLTTGFFCSAEGLKYTTLRATFLGNRKHRQQLHSKSYELA
jgi:hypothetical protein